MPKFCSEFEFKGISGNKYWFPLFILAHDLSDARQKTKSVGRAINEHYELIRSTDPRIYIEGINANYLDDYIKAALKGKLAILEMNVWEFKDLAMDEELSFNEHFDWIESDEILEEKTIAVTTGRYRFPVRQLTSSSLESFQDFLLINVVEPD